MKFDSNESFKTCKNSFSSHFYNNLTNALLSTYWPVNKEVYPEACTKLYKIGNLALD